MPTVNQKQRAAHQAMVAPKKKPRSRQPRDRAKEKLDEIAGYDAEQARLRAEFYARNPHVQS